MIPRALGEARQVKARAARLSSSRPHDSPQGRAGYAGSCGLRPGRRRPRRAPRQLRRDARQSARADRSHLDHGWHSCRAGRAATDGGASVRGTLFGLPVSPWCCLEWRKASAIQSLRRLLNHPRHNVCCRWAPRVSMQYVRDVHPVGPQAHGARGGHTLGQHQVALDPLRRDRGGGRGAASAWRSTSLRSGIG
jgi:hypothetical protein